MAKKIYIGAEKQFTITNLLGACDDVGNRGAGEVIFVNNSIFKTGSQSWIFIPSSDATEVTYMLRQNASTLIKPHLIPSHKYYFSAWLQQLTPSFGQGSFDFYWPVQEPVFLSGAKPDKANEWCLVSAIKERSSFAEGDYECRVDWNDAKANLGMFFDGLTLVDLTAAFGAGNEPDQAWCDANIPFTKTTATVSRGTAHNVKNMFIGVDGKARKVKKAYIGVGEKARLFYSASTAGINWKSGTRRPSNFTNQIAFGNGIFVCVIGLGVTGYPVDITSDGITWKSDTLPTRGKYSHIAFGNGVFIVTRDSSGQAYVSDNGTDWSISNLSQNRIWSGIAYGDKRFIILSRAGETFHTEDNGNSWTETHKIIDTVDAGTTWTSIGYGDGQFIALNSKGTSVRGNIDSWTSITIPKGEWISVAYGNDTWVAVGPDGGTGTYNMMYSKDKGATWTAKRSSGFNYGYVCFGDGRFVATSSDARNDIFWSEDGATWTRAIMPSNEIWYSAAFGNDRFIAIGNNSQVAYSE